MIQMQTKGNYKNDRNCNKDYCALQPCLVQLVEENPLKPCSIDFNNYYYYCLSADLYA